MGNGGTIAELHGKPSDRMEKNHIVSGVEHEGGDQLRGC